MQYSTIRAILYSFYNNGRINVKKKISGFTKKRKYGAIMKDETEQNYQKSSQQNDDTMLPFVNDNETVPTKNTSYSNRKISNDTIGW